MYAKYNLFVIFLLILSCFVSCKDDISVSQENLFVPAKIIRPEKSKNHKDLVSFGIISYSVKNDISSQVQGSLQEIFVKDGEQVQKNQVLAKLKNVQLEIQLEQAENSLKTAEASVLMAKTSLQDSRLSVESKLINLERLSIQIKHLELKLKDAQEKLDNSYKLFCAGGMTQVSYSSQELSVKSMEAELEILKKDFDSAELGLRDFDLINNGYIPSENQTQKKLQLIDLNTKTPQAELESALANLENAKKNLDSMQKLVNELEVKATCSGIVGGHYFEKGEHVSENENLFTLIEVEKVHGIFSVQENDICDIDEKSIVEIEIPALNKKINSRIYEISPMADSQTGNFTIKAEIDNPDFDVKPGMFIKCKVARKNAAELLSLPETVLINPDKTEEKQGHIFVVRNGLAVKSQIEIDNRNDGKIWILEGIKNDEKVIDNPSVFLREGSRVE